MTYLRRVELQRPINREIEERRKAKKLRMLMRRQAYREEMELALGRATKNVVAAAGARSGAAIDMAAVRHALRPPTFLQKVWAWIREKIFRIKPWRPK